MRACQEGPVKRNAAGGASAFRVAEGMVIVGEAMVRTLRKGRTSTTYSTSQHLRRFVIYITMIFLFMYSW